MAREPGGEGPRRQAGDRRRDGRTRECPGIPGRARGPTRGPGERKDTSQVAVEKGVCPSIADLGRAHQVDLPAAAMATHARGGEAGPSTQTNPTTVEARTALRRGANLLKYCRNAKPHVAYFQLSKDETTLEWVSKGAKVKAVRMGLVTQVIAGRETGAFRSSKHKHPPDQCFSVMYAESEGKKPRSLDLVCEDAETAQLWRLGLDAVRQRGGTGVTSEAFSSDDEDGAAPSSPIRDAKLDTMASDLGVTMKVNSAASKFMKLRSKGSDGTSVGVRSLRSSAISEPRELFLWGRLPSSLEAAGAGDDQVGGESGEFIGPSVGGYREWSLPARAPGTAGLDVRSVALGARHAAAVVRHQGVYTWGDGQGGRLGRGGDVGDRSRPCKLEGIEFKKAVEVAAGGQYSMAVSYHDVAAYVWGDASGGCHGALGMACPSVGIVSGVSRPVKMRGFPDGVRVTNVSCGAFHAAAVTAGGDLFTWGEGAFHALGHDGDKSTSPTPKRVRGLVDAGRRVCAVSCGVYHTAAVAKDAAMGPGTGELWTWGDADGGKIGHGLDAGKHPVHSPQRVHGFDADADVTSVSCGQWHTLSILADYSLWVCGSVGRVAPTDPALVPTRVDIPGSGGVEAVASGEWHAAAIGRGRGAIYTWGRGRRGALGHAGGRDEHSPRALGGTLAGGRTVHSVACGPESTAAIVSSKSMTVAERAGLTKKKDLALNFTGKPTKSLTESGLETDGSALGTPTRGGSRRGPNTHHPPAPAITRPRLARTQPGRISTSGSAQPAGVLGAGREDSLLSDGSSLAVRRAKAEALSATRERDLLRLEVKDLAARLSRTTTTEGGNVRSPEVRSPSGRRRVTSHPTTSPRMTSPDVSRTAPFSPRRSAPASTLPRIPGGLTLERDRALAARETAEAAAALAAEEAANAVAELEAKAAVLEEKVVLAEFELASLRAQVTGDRARDAGVTPTAPTLRKPLSPVARYPTLAAEARAASRAAPTGVENAVEKARSPARAARESAPAATSARTPRVNPPFPTKDSATGATTPKVIVVPTQPRTVMGDESPQPTEWVEEVEPGVFLTIARHHSSAANVLRRVRFSKTKFSDGNAQAWWERNRVRIIRARGLKLVRPAS